MTELTPISGSLPAPGSFGWGPTVNDFLYKLIVDHNLLDTLLETGRLSQTELDAAYGGASSAPTWGTIVGALVDQTDLQAALNSKQPSGSYSVTGHTHASTEVTDFDEAVRDRVGATLVAGTNVTITVSDAGNTITIAAAGGGGGGAPLWGTIEGPINDQLDLIARLDDLAPLASPVFTGNPTVPTPTVGDNDLSVANTAFVTAAVAAGGGGGGGQTHYPGVYLGSGKYTGAHTSSVSTHSPIVEAFYCSPFMAANDATIIELGTSVTIAGDSFSRLRFGLYEFDPLTLELSLLVDGGQTAASISTQSVAISQAVTKGQWLAAGLVIQQVGGTVVTRPTMRAWGGASISYEGPGAYGDSTNFVALSSGTGVTGALPALITNPSTTGGNTARTLVKIA
jgi:hypothetical protein